MRAARPAAAIHAVSLSATEHAALAAAEARQLQVDARERRRLGIVHTPAALVHFAYARIERALREDLSLVDGLASARIELVDPAVGTGIWLSALLARLPTGEAPGHITGFDSDPQVVETARALLAPAASALPTLLSVQEANTLALRSVWHAAEAVRVVVGNPPWGARSASRGLALSDAWLRDFYVDPEGQPLNERRSGVLSDDYVRFFRWALEQVREARAGAVIALVTNASYLDGPVHRGMRGALAAAFDRIEVLDLGGNSLRSRSGDADEALFPIRVGASLLIGVRRPDSPARARVVWARLRGTRASKEGALAAGEVGWSPAFTPEAPRYEFTPPRPREGTRVDGFSLDEAFPFHAEGVQTNRDDLVTDVDAAALIARLTRIARGELALRDSNHLDVETARERLRVALAEWPQDQLIGRLWYRPFEARFYCRLAPLCHRPRPLLARAAMHSELCLLSARKEPGAAPWNMFGVVRGLADSSFLSNRSSCRTRVFPSHGPDGEPNMSARVAAQIAERVGRTPSSAEMVAYIAGILGAPAFRREHDAALRRDYARVPWPANEVAFEALVAAGRAFERALCDADVSVATFSISGARAPDDQVARRALRWLSPHRIEVAPGTQIGASDQLSFQARVGHHDLVESAYRSRGSATISRVLAACARASMWARAEKTADVAYRPASCVGRAAKAFAVGD